MPFFIALQILLLKFMLLHDWVPAPPFNDVQTLRKTDGNNRYITAAINGGTVLVPLFLCISYRHQQMPFSTAFTVFSFYLCLTIGTVLSWWVPYFFGSSAKYKARFQKFKNTHHFLPARGDRIVPNTLHVVLHLMIWSCLGFSIFFL